jgi:hypothetical protein
MRKWHVTIRAETAVSVTFGSWRGRDVDRLCAKASKGGQVK